jgi:hypothetical protein
MATSTHVRLSALLLTVIGLLLLTAPFSLHDWMPPDPMEPQKKATGLLALAMLAGFAVSIGAAVMAFIAVRARDWVALAMAVPAPAVAVGFLFYFWADGM